MFAHAHVLRLRRQRLVQRLALGGESCLPELPDRPVRIFFTADFTESNPCVAHLGQATGVTDLVSAAGVAADLGAAALAEFSRGAAIIASEAAVAPAINLPRDRFCAEAVGWP